MTKDDFRRKLTKDQYQVLRKKGTEPPFSGALLHEKRDGVFACVACGNELFSSETKYDSGSGWPSFYEALDHSTVTLKDDNTHGMKRVEVVCAKCDSHLGHVFEDGPQPTGKRYCINSCALDFMIADRSHYEKEERK